MIKTALGISLAFFTLTGCGNDKESKEHLNKAASESKKAVTSATEEGREQADNMKTTASQKFSNAKEQLKAVPSAVSKGAQTMKDEIKNAPNQSDQNS